MDILSIGRIANLATVTVTLLSDVEGGVTAWFLWLGN